MDNLIQFIPVAAIAIFLLSIIEGLLRRALGEGIYSTLSSILLRLIRRTPRTLSRSHIIHRVTLRQEALDAKAENSRNNDRSLKMLMTDALRGGRTYGENDKFLGIVRKWHYQRVYLVDVFDESITIGTSGSYNVARSRLSKKWKISQVQGVSAHEVWEIRYDNIEYIDWSSSIADNTPTIFFNYPFFKSYDRKFYATYDKHTNSFEELV